MPRCLNLHKSINRLWQFIIILALVCASFSGAEAQVTNLYVKVGDTTGPSGQLNSVITVFATNFEDTISAFTLWMRFNRPDIAKFQTNLDTVVDTTYWTCLVGEYPDCDSAVSWVDSLHGPNWDFTLVDTVEAQVGNIDTVGTKIGGWDYVVSRNIDSDGNDIRLTAIANQPGGSFIPGVPPWSPGDTLPLFRLYADILPIEDTVEDRTATLEIITGNKQFFVFSRPDGTAIGYYGQEYNDSNMYRCTMPVGESCLEWTKVSLPPYDSVAYFLDTMAVLDTIEVVVDDGSITVTNGLCGNTSGDPNGDIDISDLTHLVNFLFLNGPAPEPLSVGNMNCDSEGGIDISDLTTLINFLFLGGAAPCSAGTTYGPC